MQFNSESERNWIVSCLCFSNTLKSPMTKWKSFCTYLMPQQLGIFQFSRKKEKLNKTEKQEKEFRIQEFKNLRLQNLREQNLRAKGWAGQAHFGMRLREFPLGCLG